MATIDNIISLPRPKAKTPAERAKAYRDRKRAAMLAPSPSPGHKAMMGSVGASGGNAQMVERTLSAKPGTITTRWPLARIMLALAALGLAAVGVTMNGWFARSLGSSDVAGWLFLAVGVAADLVALAVPSCAAAQWHAHKRATAAAAWAIWLMTFAFAVNAGIGFAAINISDVTTARASRLTPAVTSAQAALSDAMAARDRECAGGVGKNCRAREDTVTERRHMLDTAKLTVEHTADPQTEAASRIVVWLSGGLVKPSGDDFAMLRLILLALLPQIGGILLMIGRPD